MAHNASFLHGGELSLGNSKLLGIQAAGFGENRGPGCEEMVANLVARRRSCKTSGNWEMWSDIHFGAEKMTVEPKRSVSQKEKSC